MTCTCASTTAGPLKRYSMQSYTEVHLPEFGTAKGAIVERPFYFIVVLWGTRFRNYFLDLCLPSLLSPNNIPALATEERSKFLICTRPEDWAGLKAAPIFRLLTKYLDSVYVEIPPCPPDTPGAVHMGAGHRPASELAYAAKAYPLIPMPDW